MAFHAEVLGASPEALQVARERAGLGAALSHLASTYSVGMFRRLQLACLALGAPRLVALAHPLAPALAHAPSRAAPSPAKPSPAGRNRAQPSRADPSPARWAEPSRAQPSPAEHSQAKPSRAQPSLAQT